MSGSLKIASVVGARPQFIKLAPFSRALDAAHRPVEHLVVHTGQHYHPALSERFFGELDLPTPALNLEVGSGPHGWQTGQMLERLERAFLDLRPDVVVTYGDTNSTVAAALAAAKLHLPVAHVEAGVRSFNRRMPEEINRIAADHLADLLLAPTPTAAANLDQEGLTDRTVLTGDLMYDTVLALQPVVSTHREPLVRLGLTPGEYGLVTIHRAENTDDPTRLGRLLTGLELVAARGLPLVFPVHPRTAAALHRRGWQPPSSIHILPPAGYVEVLTLVAHARVTLTDSGGLQKEAFFLGCPAVTLREETEWVETVQAGANVLAGTDPDRILQAVLAWERRYSTGRPDFAAEAASAFGDGRAAVRIRDAVFSRLGHLTGSSSA
jgi:UDP-N-acetylglucosamine 2-epimerase